MNYKEIVKKELKLLPLIKEHTTSTIQQIQVNKYVLSNSLPSRISNSTTGAKVNQQVTVRELPSTTGA